MPTIFGSSCGKFLNFSQNSDIKYNILSSNIIKLYNSIMSQQFIIPTLDKDYLSLISDVDLAEHNLFRTLSYIETKNNISNKVGYNPIKIMQASQRNIDNIIESLDRSYAQQILQYDTILKYTNTNIYLHKLIGFIYNDIYTDKITNYNLLKFQYSTSLFHTIFRTYSYNYSGFKYDDVLSIPCLFAYINMVKFYTQSTDLNSIILSNAYSGDFSNLTLANDFRTYLNRYKSSISNALANYFINNVFMFGGVISSNIQSHLCNIISSILPQIGDIFYAKYDDYIGADFAYSVTQTIYQNLIQYHCLNLLNDSLYNNIPSFFNLSNVHSEDFLLNETTIANNIISYIKSNPSIFETLDYISFNYKDDPLTFLNIFEILYSKLNISALSDFDIFKLSEVNDWLNIMTIPSTNCMAVKNYIEQNPITYPGDNSGVFQTAFFLHFKQVISDFCESDEFKNYIINTFIPNVENGISQKYHIDIQDYMYVDNVVCFFKILFTYHLTQTDNNQFILFGDYISRFKQIVNTSISNSTFLLTDILVESLQTNFVNDINIYYYVFNSFFKSSFFSKYLLTRLNTYSL